MRVSAAPPGAGRGTRPPLPVHNVGRGEAVLAAAAAGRIQVDVGLRRQEAMLPSGAVFVAVIDVLRATSTIVTALAAGAARVIPVDSLEAALALRAADERRLLAGERGAQPIPGFDFGNSPAALLDLRVTGQEVVLTTTNGSRALAWAVGQGGAVTVVALALVNTGAVVRAAIERAPDSIYLLCSGTEGRVSLDDLYVAGAAIDALQNGPLGVRLEASDAAKTALAVYRSAPQHPYAVLASAAAGRNLLRKGYRADVEFCARRDIFDVVPLWREDALYKA